MDFSTLAADLKSTIRDVPDFPKPGILFKDITPVLQNPKLLSEVSYYFTHQNMGLHVDKVVSVESRGFIFGSILANDLHAGFVPVRKKGKLPADVLSVSYSLEYGEAELEIHRDSIRPGDRVVIHDDVLATGGTVGATIELVEKLGGKVVNCCFLIELAFLDGRKKLKGYPVHSLLSF
ncbi:MAG: adenine phosphoribosyltransferase [Bacteroidetes bacterium]|nr:adenine phosphoribosyltransferase [Bacteroidota bacterium]